jgi:hypothetical protein
VVALIRVVTAASAHPVTCVVCRIELLVYICIVRKFLIKRLINFCNMPCQPSGETSHCWGKCLASEIFSVKQTRVQDNFHFIFVVNSYGIIFDTCDDKLAVVANLTHHLSAGSPINQQLDSVPADQSPFPGNDISPECLSALLQFPLQCSEPSALEIFGTESQEEIHSKLLQMDMRELCR